jgi:hypothetical protein
MERLLEAFIIAFDPVLASGLGPLLPGGNPKISGLLL